MLVVTGVGGSIEIDISTRFSAYHISNMLSAHTVAQKPFEMFVLAIRVPSYLKRVTTYSIDNASVKSSPRDFIMRRDSIWKVGRHDSTFKKQNVQQLKIMYLLKVKPLMTPLITYLTEDSLKNSHQTYHVPKNALKVSCF